MINKLTKLKEISFAEIVFRLRDIYIVFKERLKFKLKYRPLNKLFLPPEIRKFKPAQLSGIKFFALAESRESLLKTINSGNKKIHDRCVFNADKLLSHQIVFLGQSFKLQESINWKQNPLSGQEYEDVYSKDLQIYNSNKYGDIKYLWELNRHQFFVEIAKAYYLTGDEKYANKIWHFIDTWITQNPFKVGVNWTSALESSVRIFAWAWTYNFTKDSAIWTNDNKQRFFRHLLLEGIFIKGKLSYYFSPYNHLIGELAALTLIGMLFPGHPVSKKWGEKYWAELEQQFDLQFDDDGFSVEKASYYHHFTLGFYLSLAILRKQNGLSIRPDTWGRIEKAIEFCMFLKKPDGKMPMIGDIDNARSIYFYNPDETQWSLSFFQSLGAVLFNRGDFKCESDGISEELIWLLGSDGVNRFNEMESETPRFGSVYFKHAGLFIMRNGWQKNSDYLLFDIGEIAHGLHKNNIPSAAHGHADILSYELSINGSSVLIDPGLSTYFGDENFHQYFRETKGHNNIEINGKSQANYVRRITWNNVSSPLNTVVLTSAELDFACGELDKFFDLDPNVAHSRHVIFLKEKYVIIVDYVFHRNGPSAINESYDIRSFLHFAPGGIQIDPEIINWNNKTSIRYFSSQKSTFNQYKGGDKAEQGWIAPGYGTTIPAPVVEISTETQLPVVSGVLVPIKNTKIKKINFSPISNTPFKVEINLENETDELYLNFYREKLILNSIQTDSKMILVDRTQNNVGTIYLLENDLLIIDSKETVREKFVRLENDRVEILKHEKIENTGN